MNHVWTLCRNVVSNWAGYGVSIIFTLAMTPVMIRQLGDTRYGIWVITSSFMGYYGLLDLGFRSGVTQYLTRYLARSDYRKVNAAASSAVAALSTVGLIIALISLGVAYGAPRLLALPADINREAFWAILVVGFSCAVQCVFFPFSAVFTATQRFDIASGIGIVTRIVTAGAMYISLRHDGGLVGVSVAVALGNIADYLIRWKIAYRILPQLIVSRRLVSWQDIRHISAFGAWNCIVAISSVAGAHAHSLIIAAMMPVAAIAHYALAANLVRQLTDVFNPIGQVFYPLAASLHARGDYRGLREVLLSGSRCILLVVCSACVLAGTLAESFYRFWVGNRYVAGDVFPSVAVLLQICLCSAVSYVSNIPAQIVIGSGRVKTNAIFGLCETLLRILISIVLIRQFGLIGMAFAGVAAAGVSVVGITAVAARITAISPWQFYVSACARPLLVGVAITCLMLVVKKVYPAEALGDVLVQGIYGLIAALSLVIFIGLKGVERKQFIWKPIRTIYTRLYSQPEAPRMQARAAGD